MTTIVRQSFPERSPLWRTYWYFAAERQRIFLARHRGDPLPWTEDSILQDYRFTNAYRAADRVSQFLIQNVIHDGNARTFEDTVARILLFKIFNRIETWSAMTAAAGDITADLVSEASLGHILDSLVERKTPLYNAAYIIPPIALGGRRKHHNHLRLIRLMLDDGLVHKLEAAGSLRGIFEILLTYPSLGPFLAYQFAIDLNYSDALGFSESEFVQPGPGAVRGIRKCFSDPGDYSDADLVKFMVDMQEEAPKQLGIVLPNLWGRPLQLIDCQNLFCELDKYARVAFPHLNQGGRSRIKQRFGPKLGSYPLRFPPSWNLSPERARASDDRVHESAMSLAAR